MMFAVVKKVAMPPSRLAKEIGISSLLGLIPLRRATSIALGSSSAPAATLFITSDSSATVNANNATSRRSDVPPIDSRRCAIHCVMPTLSNACVMMNRLISVNTTGCPNPAMARDARSGESGGPSTPHPANCPAPSAAAMISAAVSARSRLTSASPSGIASTAIKYNSTQVMERPTQPVLKSL